MTYTVQQLARAAGVTVRTLHHYDAIGLLSPSRREKNTYRSYGDTELFRLQQILFFRELDFSLTDIKTMLDHPRFDPITSLQDQKRLLGAKKQRLENLMNTIDTTIKTMQQNQPADAEELYGDFTEKEMNDLKKEARQKWGNTEAWKQSQERTKNWTKADYARVKEAGETILQNLIAHMEAGLAPESPEAQTEVAKQYAGLRNFYEPSPEIFRGLADMYSADARFAAYYAKFHKDLLPYLQTAMKAYANTLEHS